MNRILVPVATSQFNGIIRIGGCMRTLDGDGLHCREFLITASCGGCTVQPVDRGKAGHYFVFFLWTFRPRFFWGGVCFF